MAEENNGGREGAQHTQSTLVLTLDRATFRLTIGGHTENLDEALAILEMAHRDIEAKIRAAQAGELLNVSGRIPLNFDPRGPRRA